MPVFGSGIASGGASAALDALRNRSGQQPSGGGYSAGFGQQPWRLPQNGNAFTDSAAMLDRAATMAGNPGQISVDPYQVAQVSPSTYDPMTRSAQTFQAAQVDGLDVPTWQPGGGGMQPAQRPQPGDDGPMDGRAPTGAGGADMGTFSRPRMPTAPRGDSGGSTFNIQAGQLADTDMNPYLNPYTQQVVETTNDELARRNSQLMNSLGAQASAAGAFGGSRHGLVEAEQNRNYLDQIARTSAQLNQQGFESARQGAQFDIGARLSADEANLGSATDRSVARTRAGATTAAAAASAAASMYGADRRLDIAGLDNRGAYDRALVNAGTSRYTSDNSLQASMYGADASLRGSMYGTDAGVYNNTLNNSRMRDITNAELQQEAARYGAEAGNLANRDNMDAINTAGQFNAGHNQGAGVINAGAINQMRGNTQQLRSGADQANAQLGLDSAGLLGDLGRNSYDIGRTTNADTMAQGEFYRGLQQDVLNGAQGQFQGYTDQELRALGLLGSAAGGTGPTATTTTSGYDPGIGQRIGAGLNAAGGLLDEDLF